MASKPEEQDLDLHSVWCLTMVLIQQPLSSSCISWEEFITSEEDCFFSFSLWCHRCHSTISLLRSTTLVNWLCQCFQDLMIHLLPSQLYVSWQHTLVPTTGYRNTTFWALVKWKASHLRSRSFLYTSRLLLHNQLYITFMQEANTVRHGKSVINPFTSWYIRHTCLFSAEFTLHTISWLQAPSSVTILNWQLYATVLNISRLLSVWWLQAHAMMYICPTEDLTFSRGSLWLLMLLQPSLQENLFSMSCIWWALSCWFLEAHWHITFTTSCKNSKQSWELRYSRSRYNLKKEQQLLLKKKKREEIALRKFATRSKTPS